MNRRKIAKENLQYFRKHPDYAPPNKNAASTVWLYGIRAVNGVAFGVYTARPKGGHLNYATRLSAGNRKGSVKMTKQIKERDIAAYLTKRVAEIGGIYRKVSWEGRSDAPDYLIMCGGIHIFVETKAPNKKPRASQLREFSAMLNHGGLAVVVVSTLREVDAFINGIQICRHLPPENTSQS